MNCKYCNNPVPFDTNNCPSCGAPVQQQAPQQQAPQQQAPQQQAPQQPVAQKSANTATLLSCLLVGAGQMYNGQVVKGIVMLVAAIVISSLTGGVAGPVFWIIAMVDAHKIANKINSGRPVGEWEFF